MAQSRVKVKIVSLREPCTACVILDGLVKETLEKIKREYDNIDIETIELENLNQVHLIEGLEVEKFPAILVNNEQITAGSLPSKKQLIELLKQGGM